MYQSLFLILSLKVEKKHQPLFHGIIRTQSLLLLTTTLSLSPSHSTSNHDFSEYFETLFIHQYSCRLVKLETDPSVPGVKSRLYTISVLSRRYGVRKMTINLSHHILRIPPLPQFETQGHLNSGPHSLT